jgi:hypothetical protein
MGRPAEICIRVPSRAFSIGVLQVVLKGYHGYMENFIYLIVEENHICTALKLLQNI